jgi:hypothetical protein
MIGTMGMKLDRAVGRSSRGDLEGLGERGRG